MANGDPKFPETYQQRISEIQEVSDVIAVANLQLGKLLQKFGWSRQSFNDKVQMIQCPIDSTHSVKEDNVTEHMKICTARKIQMISVKSNDFLPSSSFFYEESNVVSVNLNEEDYAKVGAKVPGSDGQPSKEGQHARRKSYLNARSLIENNAEICLYTPCDPLDELRFIYSWTKIPPKYFSPNLSPIPENNLKQWLLENMPGSNDTGNENKQSIASYIMNQLNKTGQPDEMVQLLLPVLKLKTTEFVLKLWKFLCGKALCHLQHIPEHTRNEFDHYGSASLKSKQATMLVVWSFLTSSTEMYYKT